MNLWIPDLPGQTALGELPEAVVCQRFPLPGSIPDAILDAEFLVPSWRAGELYELLPRMRKLRVVQTISAGVDWILPSVPPGVTVCDARSARDATVAEWVLAAILAQTKRLGEFRDLQRESSWQWSELEDLAASTVLILGYGSIGKAVEARLAPFEVDVIRVARHARTGTHGVEELTELLPRANVLVVLLPLTSETSGLLDAGMLTRLPAGALLVNAARGSVIDQEALLELLHAGRLRAALDVTDPEPLPAKHPLWGAPGVLITPHLAGDSARAEQRAFALVREQVRRYVKGEQLVNIIESGY